MEISTDKLQANVAKIRELIPENTKIWVVTKGDAYGLGAIAACKVISDKVEGFCVATIHEGIELRKAGIKNSIFLLSEPLKVDFPKIIQFDLDISLYSEHIVKALDLYVQKHNVKVKTHFKIDTGLPRLGHNPDTEGPVLDQWFSTHKNIEKVAIWTHLQNAETGDHGKDNDLLSLQQKQKFYDVVSKYPKVQYHLANSFATEFLDGFHADIVRPGVCIWEDTFTLSNGTENNKVCK